MSRRATIKRFGKALGEAGFMPSLRRCEGCGKGPPLHYVYVRGDEYWHPGCGWGALRPETKQTELRAIFEDGDNRQDGAA